MNRFSFSFLTSFALVASFAGTVACSSNTTIQPGGAQGDDDDDDTGTKSGKDKELSEDDCVDRCVDKASSCKVAKADATKTCETMCGNSKITEKQLSCFEDLKCDADKAALSECFDAPAGDDDDTTTDEWKCTGSLTCSVTTTDGPQGTEKLIFDAPGRQVPLPRADGRPAPQPRQRNPPSRGRHRRQLHDEQDQAADGLRLRHRRRCRAALRLQVTF